MLRERWEAGDRLEDPERGEGLESARERLTGEVERLTGELERLTGEVAGEAAAERAARPARAAR